jgi:C4-dicarboxylate-specific signal transduction histidine kinase
MIAVERANGDVQIEVRDNGPGIPSEIMSRIFDPFFTTKDAVHGVGLGLFVAEGLVRTAGGRITAGQVSALSAGGNQDHGAWFRIELPIAPALTGFPAHRAQISA